MRNHKVALTRIAVFDICDTIYYSNTTHDFIRFIFNKKPFSLKKLVYQVFNNKISPLRYLSILISVLLHWDLPKKLNVYLLKGVSQKQLYTMSVCFVSEFLKDKQIKQTSLLINEYAKQDLRIVLCSSSIEPIVKAIAENYGIKDFIASSLMFENEVFTGKISEEISSKKLEVLDRLNLADKIEYAVSDNITDVKLLLAAKRGIAVVHNKKQQNYWSRFAVDIINLSL